MSIAQSLPNVVPIFMQECPLCGRNNRITVLGVYRDEKKCETYPDMGYSFCNCKNVFYTNFENLTDETSKIIADPVKRMAGEFCLMRSGDTKRLVLPDPFFCEWGNDPYKSFLHWSPRRHWILWDKDQFEEEMKAIGFDVLSSRREFDVQSQYPQTFEIILRKP